MIILLYTDLPKVTREAEAMRHEVTMVDQIKIKLMRAGFFNNESISNFDLSGTNFMLKGLSLGIDKCIHLHHSTAENRMSMVRSLTSLWIRFLIQRINDYLRYLTPEEVRFLLMRINIGFPLFARFEFYGDSDFVIRV